MKYKSCNMIEHGLIFSWKDVVTCCSYNAGDKGDVLFDKYFNSKDFSIENIMKKKKEIRLNFKNGKILKGCINCYNLEEKNWDDEDYINCIYISHWTKCNCNCFYCYYDPQKYFFQKFKNNKIMPLLNKMNKNNLIRNNGYFVITGGEPSELNELDNIINFCLKNDINTIYLNSSCIKYEKSIEKALKKDKIEITLSLDCSDKNLYKKIKRIDAFDKVINNIKKYIKAQNTKKDAVRIKYIIIPNINDSEYEIEKWLLLCCNLGVQKVIMDVETNWYLSHRNNIPQKIQDLIKYFKKRTKELGLLTDFYSHAAQINHDYNNTENL